MIDLEKSKIEAEALAKLRKEQYFREVLAGELGVMIDQHFASKEPLREILPVFCTELKDLTICAREIFDYLEGLQEVAPEEPEQAAEPEPEKAPSTAAEPDPIAAQAAEPAKLTSKQILPDEELERRYFKEGLSIPQIAKKYNLGQAGLYKRIEAIKDVKDDIEKECARRKK